MEGGGVPLEHVAVAWALPVTGASSTTATTHAVHDGEESTTHVKALLACTKCKVNVADSARKERLCLSCAARVRGAEAVRKAQSNKRRKDALENACAVAQQREEKVASLEASALLLQQAISSSTFPSDEVRQLCEHITADKRKATADGPVSGHCEMIMAKYGEMHVRWKETEDVHDPRYEKYDKLMKKWRATPRHHQQVKLLTEGISLSVDAFDRAARKRAHLPVAIHTVAVLAQMGYEGLSSTMGPAGWTPADTPGQCLHADVMMPEIQGLAYWSDGTGTLAYNGEEMSDQDMATLTGLVPNCLSGPTRTTYYQAKNLMLPHTTIEAGLTQAAWRDASGATVPCEKVGGMAPAVRAGDLAIMDGGVPHAGPPVPAGGWQVRLFMIATPLRTMNPYDGYIQIIGGEVELFWACMGKTEEARKACWDAWLTALPYWMHWYEQCRMEEVDGPVSRVLRAVVGMRHEGDLKREECDEARCVLRNAIKHVRSTHASLGLHNKWGGMPVGDVYPGLAELAQSM